MARAACELGRYLEHWGILLEQLGGTRMMGRVLAWLLICDPPEQTAAAIARGVGASAGSVSTTTRALEQMGMIERLGVPGERSAFFRMRSGTWGRLMRRRMSHLSRMSELAEEGIRRFAGEDPERALRLREVGSYCDFIEREFPELLRRWEELWDEERKR